MTARKDRTDFYLAALNSHDGSSAWRCLVTPVRIVCANTQSAAIGSAKASFGIRHTGGATASIQEARNALKLSWRYIEAFEAEAAELYAQPMDTEQMRRFANTLLEVDSAGTAATARHRRERASGHRQTVDVLADHRTDRRHPVGGLQRGHRVPGPHRPGPRRAHRHVTPAPPARCATSAPPAAPNRLRPRPSACCKPSNRASPPRARPAPHHEGWPGPPSSGPPGGGAPRATAVTATRRWPKPVAPHLYCRQQGSQPNRPGARPVNPRPRPAPAAKDICGPTQLAAARGPQIRRPRPRTLRG